MNRLLPLLLLAACGGAGPTEAPPAAKSDEHTHDGHAGHDAHAAGGHDAHGAHMAEMGRIRDGLRTTLGAAYDAPVPGLDTADATAGAALYATHCAACHGATGKGDGEAGRALTPPPSDLTDAFHARFYSDAGRLHLIRTGATGTAMPAFSPALDDAAILSVYAHVRTLRGAVGTP